MKLTEIPRTVPRMAKRPASWWKATMAAWRRCWMEPIATDTKLLDPTLEAVEVERPQRPPEEPQNLCLDKGYDNPTGRAAGAKHGYVPHIWHIGEKFNPDTAAKTFPARRWVIGRTIAWLSQCRAILILWDVQNANYLGLILQLASTLLRFRCLTQLQDLRSCLSRATSLGLVASPQSNRWSPRL